MEKLITADTIRLSAPRISMDYPLMKALENRRSTRKLADTAVSEQDLSNLLWAACGITKKKTTRLKSKRTAPSSCNSQAIRVYVLLENGVFLYNEENHELVPKTTSDIRRYVGTQKMVQSAPLGLVFVADLSRMKSPVLRNEKARQLSAWVDTGFISQNIYLYCAASDLGTVVLSLVNRDKLGTLMELREHEKIVLTQVVGYRV